MRPRGELLDRDEIRSLTAERDLVEQDHWLTDHEIPHRLEGARLLVSRVDVRAWLASAPTPRAEGPNWAAVR